MTRIKIYALRSVITKRSSSPRSCPQYSCAVRRSLTNDSGMTVQSPGSLHSEVTMCVNNRLPYWGLSTLTRKSAFPYSSGTLNKQMNGVLDHDAALKGYTGPGITWANEMNFVWNHASGAASIARPIAQQCSLLLLCPGLPLVDKQCIINPYNKLVVI